MRVGRALTTTALGLAGVALGFRPVYDNGPPPAHTGGFGEPTCTACHRDAPLNDGVGAITLRLPAGPYQSGATYTLVVELTRSGLARGGFELSARYADGPAAGTQAGALAATDERVAVSDTNGVQYAHHTLAGTTPTTPDTSRWAVAWQAPSPAAGPIVFHLAGNAANDDASEFGDHIYTSVKRSHHR